MSAGAFIGKVAGAVGVGVQTVRYYERVGLLPPSQRTPSGYRLYSPETVNRLRFIRQAQVAGFRLKEIKEILRLKYAGQSPCNCVRELLQQKLEAIEREIIHLKRFRRELQKALRHSQKLRRLPHTASSICPIVQGLPARVSNQQPAAVARRKGSL